jgi:hypothetical protein
MAWKLTIGGVDKTSLVSQTQRVQVELLQNDRSQATFYTLPDYLPDRFAEVVIYAQDGTTPIFGGLIMNRAVTPLHFGADPYLTKVECADFFTYLDWTYVSLSYDAPVTMKQVLTDLVAELPASYSITVDGAQVDGPTVDPFSWVTVKASDAIRELSTRTAYVAKMSPLKALRLLVPGTDLAAVSIEDGDTNCQEFTWTDPDAVPYNTVRIRIGTAGVTVTQVFTVAGGGQTFVSDFPAINDLILQGYISVDTGAGIVNATVSRTGEGGMFEWDMATHTLTEVSYPGGLTNGWTVALPYQPNFPYEITATTGATPEIEYLAQDFPDVTSLSQGQEIADGLLASLSQTAREATIVSLVHGWDVGQSVTVDLAERDVAADFSITEVRIELISDQFWRYELKAQETTTYQGNYLDRWDDLLGGSGSGGALTLTPGTFGGGIAPYVLSGTGHPQGVVAAAVGYRYLDTNTGYWYAKTGGGSTAYGWYLLPLISAAGPTPYYLVGGDASNGVPQAVGLNAGLSQSNNQGPVSFADGFYNASVTNGSTGTNGGFLSGLQPYWWDVDFDLVLRMRTGTTLTDTRFWFGLTSASLTNSDDLTGSGIMFRFSATTDGGFMGYSRAASSSLTAQVNAIAVSTAYILRIRFVRTGTPTVYFSVNDGTEVAKTTDIPATGTASGIAFWVYNKNATAQAVYYKSIAMMSGT